MWKNILALLMISCGLLPTYVMAEAHAADGQDEPFVAYHKKSANGKPQISKSRLDYKEIANTITAGCTTDYQRLKAIYQWICDNIVYDTSYKIKTADECYATRKGICQAYNELYYQIATAIGLRIEFIDGISKDKNGFVEDSGHSWLFGYTSDDRGIFMDPTWGAGYLMGSQFVKRSNCWAWFNVAPEWMILSHFPRDKGYQLITPLMDKQEFLALAPVTDLCLDYHMDIHHIYKSIREEGNTLPKLYSKGEAFVDLTDIPLQKALKVGEKYAFRLHLKADCDLSLNNNSIAVRGKEWKDEGDSIFTLEYMVRDVDNLTIGIKEKANSYWNILVNYQIEEPTDDDWKKVEKLYPLSAPEAKAVKNLYADRWAAAGVDAGKLLSLIREHHVDELPLLFNDKGQRLTIVTVPMTRVLKIGMEYTFSFYPKSGASWAVVNNGKWFADWHTAADGQYTMTVTPTAAGPLYLYMQSEQDQSYWPCLQYEVTGETPPT